MLEALGLKVAPISVNDSVSLELMRYLSGPSPSSARWYQLIRSEQTIWEVVHTGLNASLPE